MATPNTASINSAVTIFLQRMLAKTELGQQQQDTKTAPVETHDAPSQSHTCVKPKREKKNK